MKTTRIGKITKALIGFCGPELGQFGLYLELGGRSPQGDTGWGCSVIDATWGAVPRPADVEWSEQQRTTQLGLINLRLIETLGAAEVGSVAELVGKPVQAIFNPQHVLESWRILKEVL